MKVGDKYYTSIWFKDEKLWVIDQRWLPHRFVEEEDTTRQFFEIPLRLAA